VTFPEGYPRTPADKREWSSFTRTRMSPHGYKVTGTVTFTDALQDLQAEIRRAGGSNLRIDQDGAADAYGVPMAGKKEPVDPGVVVYWTRRGKQYVIACDRYKTRAENLRAIAKTIEATRGIERWGAVTAEQAYRGYEALPPPGGTSGAPPSRPPHEVLNVQQGAPASVVRAAFNALAKDAHPDKGGTTERFRELVAARDALLGGGP
jgi:hypothetical protein